MKRPFAALSSVIVLLVGSGWLAYSLGARHQSARTAPFIESTIEECEFNDLRIRIEALRIVANHPGAFSRNEIQPFCSRTEEAMRFSLQSAERFRQAGNDPQADRLQKRVDEARRLLEQLNR